MAGDWIKMRSNLWDDPRVARICDLTDSGEALIVGGLYWLWATADQHTENGTLPGLTLRQIDRKTGIQGFGAALCAVGWLVDHPDGVRIVRFEEHNGTSAKRRAVTAKRVANHRSGNADVTQEALQDDDDSVRGALARERERERERDSVPKGTGAEAPDAIWETGLQFLVGKGVKEKGARGFLGKMRNAVGELVAAELLAKAQAQDVSDPLAWLRAAAGRRTHGEREKSGVAL